jgi:hypothetical protein
MVYAHVRDNIVINVFEWLEQSPPDIAGDIFVELSESQDKNIIGWSYDPAATNTFTAPHLQSTSNNLPTLEISLDKTTAIADGVDAITLNFTIKNADGTIMTTFTGDYKVALRRDDGTIYKIFKTSVSNGQGSISIKSKTAGRFKLIPSDFTNTKLSSEIVFDFVLSVSGSVEL